MHKRIINNNLQVNTRLLDRPLEAYTVGLLLLKSEGERPVIFLKD